MHRLAGLALFCIALSCCNQALAAESKKDCANPDVILACVLVPWDKPVPEGITIPEGGSWQAPLPPAVQDAHAAIAIAHTEWQSMHPHSNVGSDDDWQKAFRADLAKGVWLVATKTWTDTHGAFVVYINAQDGQLAGAQYVD